MLGKLRVWIVRVLEPGATIRLERELAHVREMVVPKLEREIEVLKKELQLWTSVNARNLARVDAEMAQAAKAVASLGEQ